MKNVMIIEDDPMVLAINKKFLSKIDGFKVVAEATNLLDAKEKIMLHQPDLILLDVFFPTGKGIDLLKWIRSKEMSIDAILITADRSSETVAEAFRFGAVDYLIKPFKFERFEEALLSYKALKSKLNQSKHVNQAVIDQLTNHEYNKNGYIELDTFLMDDEVKNQTFIKVVEFIEAHPDMSFTSQSIAADLGISRITARRYLDDLEKNKFLRMELEYGSVGRPKNNYYLNRGNKQ